MNFIVAMTIYINDWCYYNFISEKKKHKNKIYADWKECKEMEEELFEYVGWRVVNEIKLDFKNTLNL